MTEPNAAKNDVNMEVVATGCGTSCATGCATFLLAMLFVALVGAPAAARSSGVLSFLGFILGAAGEVLVGYVTARAARAKNLPVNMHIFVVGGLIMALGLASSLLPSRDPNAAQKAALGILSSLLVIPFMLWGASLHADDTKPD